MILLSSMKKALLSALILIAASTIYLTFVKSAKSSSHNDILKSLDKVIPDQYIVVYKDTVSNPDSVTDDLEKIHSLKSKIRFAKVLKGYSAVFTQEKLERVKRDPRVAFVTEDKEISMLFHTTRRRPTKTPTKTRTPTPVKSPTPTFTKTPTSTPTTSVNTQSIPSGVSRIGLNATNEGEGIGVAILDTGIDLDHSDLAANIVANKSCISGAATGDDDQGHGTHVAGTVAAVNNSFGVIGVAPQAKLIAVKVLNSQGSGSYSSLICGIDWVTANVSNYNIKVANMSLGGGGSSDDNCGNSNGDALHLAICRSRDAGVTYVAAAGNNSSNAANSVPAAYDDTVITVSALADSDGQSGGLGPATSYGADDTFATFSNYGRVVDLGAPGVSIYSTYKNNGYASMSGTSMSTPHVAGAAALYLKTNPSASWTSVRDGLKAAGEPLGAGHTDPSGFHPEQVVKVGSL